MEPITDKPTLQSNGRLRQNQEDFGNKKQTLRELIQGFNSNTSRDRQDQNTERRSMGDKKQHYAVNRAMTDSMYHPEGTRISSTE